MSTWFDGLTREHITALAKQINDQEFDHVFRITPMGCVDGPQGLYGPESVELDILAPNWIYLEDKAWTPIVGYSAQSMVSRGSAVMHPSESVRGNFARDIIEKAAEYDAEDTILFWCMTVIKSDDGEDAGWGIFYFEMKGE
jgi:hypothetical protein